MAEEECSPWDCIIADVDTATQFLPQVRYNAKLLSFLCHQMEKIASIKLQEVPSKNTLLYESMIVLRDEIKKDVKLVKKHAQCFNIQTFYGVEQKIKSTITTIFAIVGANIVPIPLVMWHVPHVVV